MQILLALLTVFLLLILWVIFMPVHLMVDTENRIYKVYQLGTFHFSIHPGQKPFLRMRVMGFPVTVPVTKNEEEKPKPKGKRKKTFIKRPLSAWLGLLRGIARSFRVRKLSCRINSGDYVLNAKLYSLIVPLNTGVIDFQVDFHQHSLLQLEIEARINQMIWSFITFIFKK